MICGWKVSNVCTTIFLSEFHHSFHAHNECLKTISRVMASSIQSSFFHTRPIKFVYEVVPSRSSSSSHYKMPQAANHHIWCIVAWKCCASAALYGCRLPTAIDEHHGNSALRCLHHSNAIASPSLLATFPAKKKASSSAYHRIHSYINTIIVISFNPKSILKLVCSSQFFLPTNSIPGRFTQPAKFELPPALISGLLVCVCTAVSTFIISILYFVQRVLAHDARHTIIQATDRMVFFISSTLPQHSNVLLWNVCVVPLSLAAVCYSESSAVRKCLYAMLVCGLVCSLAILPRRSCCVSFTWTNLPLAVSYYSVQFRVCAPCNASFRVFHLLFLHII